jgi:hypothetical protein
LGRGRAAGTARRDRHADSKRVTRAAVVDQQLNSPVADPYNGGELAARGIQRTQLTVAQRPGACTGLEQDLRSRLLWRQRSADSQRQHKRRQEEPLLPPDCA